MKKIVLLAIMLISFPAMSFAAIATGSLSVSATVAAAGTCSTGVFGFGFGTVTPPFSTNIDSATGLSVQCPNQTPYTVALSTGNGMSYNPRYMTDGQQNLLAYNIYLDGAYTTERGDGTAGTQTVTGMGSGGAISYPLYFRLPPQATPVAGDYLDMVNITVIY